MDDGKVKFVQIEAVDGKPWVELSCDGVSLVLVCGVFAAVAVDGYIDEAK